MLSSVEPAIGYVLNDRSLWEWQRRALSSWHVAGNQGVVEAITGTGKTLVGVAAIDEFLQRGGRALVLVPTTALLRQWAEVLDRELPQRTIGLLGDGKVASLDRVDVLVSTVHSASRRQLLPLGVEGILVADECHRYGTATFARALDVGFEARLGLTATFERNDDGVEKHLEPYFGGIVYRYSFREAMADNVIAPFRVGLIGVRLGVREEQEYETYREAAVESRTTLVNRLGLPAEPFGEFMDAANKLAKEWAPGARVARKYLHAFSKYRAILASASQKLDLIPKLAPAVNDAGGTLLFAETIRASESVAQRLRDQGVTAAALHSGMRPREREGVLDSFRKRAIAAVAAPRVLDEGIDVPEADLGVIVAASATKRQMIQRLGRVVRLKADSRPARVVIMFVVGTQEDPANGGHQAFLDEIRPVADEWRVFYPDQLGDLLAFMSVSTTVPVAPVATGWWETWSTNEPARGLVIEVSAGDGDSSSPWWIGTEAGDFANVGVQSDEPGLPEWIEEVTPSPTATEAAVTRVIERIARATEPLGPIVEERLRTSELVNLIARHPPPVTEALVRAERDRLRLLGEGDDQVADVVGTGERPRVRVRRAMSSPSVLMEPETNEYWQP